MLNLPGLAGSIASVALSLAGCLVFHDTRDPAFSADRRASTSAVAAASVAACS